MFFLSNKFIFFSKFVIRLFLITLGGLSCTYSYASDLQRLSYLFEKGAWNVQTGIQYQEGYSTYCKSGYCVKEIIQVNTGTEGLNLFDRKNIAYALNSTFSLTERLQIGATVKGEMANILSREEEEEKLKIHRPRFYLNGAELSLKYNLSRNIKYPGILLNLEGGYTRKCSNNGLDLNTISYGVMAYTVEDPISLSATLSYKNIHECSATFTSEEIKGDKGDKSIYGIKMPSESMVMLDLYASFKINPFITFAIQYPITFMKIKEIELNGSVLKGADVMVSRGPSFFLRYTPQKNRSFIFYQGYRANSAKLNEHFGMKFKGRLV